jgi:hypothetical protein
MQEYRRFQEWCSGAQHWLNSISGAIRSLAEQYDLSGAVNLFTSIFLTIMPESMGSSSKVPVQGIGAQVTGSRLRTVCKGEPIHLVL